ncbi:MAG: hypothetical protein R3A80_12935 [Bdellovibrionota bacterium]
MPKQTPIFSPWLVGLLPWVIDLLFRTSFLNSFWGALLWGLLLVVYFAGAKLKDPKLKANLNSITLLLSITWLVGWIRALLYPIENPLKPAASLYFMHGTFLVAAAGMLLLVFVGSIAGLFAQKKLFAPRNTQTPETERGPSVEGIIKLCSWSLSLARRFWVLGTALAITALAVQIAHNHESWVEEFSRWIHDPAVWCVLGLATLLILSKYFIHSTLKLNLLFRSYLILALTSLIAVSAVLWVENSKNTHFQKEFLR